MPRYKPQKVLQGLSIAALLSMNLCISSTDARELAPETAPTPETIVERAFLPSARNAQGEFRLARIGASWRAQTVLDTRSLRRALQKIRKKELARWSGETPRDSVQYLEALAQAKEEILSQPAHPSGRHQLLIETEATPTGGSVAVYAVRAERMEDGYSVLREREIVLHRVSPTYAHETIVLQSTEAFGHPPELP